MDSPFSQAIIKQYVSAACYLTYGIVTAYVGIISLRIAARSFKGIKAIVCIIGSTIYTHMK